MEVTASHPANLGIQLTGYLWKQKVRNLARPWERRFVVLTQSAIHWFRRDEATGTDLFGEETGRLDLSQILKVTPFEEVLSPSELRRTASEQVSSPSEIRRQASEQPSASSPSSSSSSSSSPPPTTVYSFRLVCSDGFLRCFRCSSLAERSRWVEACTYAVAASERDRSAPTSSSHATVERRMTLSGMDFAPRTVARGANGSIDASDGGGGGGVGGGGGGSADKSAASYFLYHSRWGGSCFGGAAPPVPVVALFGGRAVAADSGGGGGSGMSREGAFWGKDLKIEFRTTDEKSVTSTQVLEIFLSNGGVVSLPVASLTEMTKMSKPSIVQVSGLRYPGDPPISAKVQLSVVGSASPPGRDHPFSLSQRLVIMVGMASIFLKLNWSALNQEDWWSHVSLTSNGLAILSYAVVSAASWLLLSRGVGGGGASSTFVVSLLAYTEGDSQADTDAGSLVKPVPHRFKDNCSKDPPGSADAKWAKTIAWRTAGNIDKVLLEKQPHFERIKVCYPHFFGRLDKASTRVCYFERPGYLQLKELTEIGLDAMVRHKMFCVEFLWSYVAPHEETTTLSGIDISNVGMYDLKGVVKEYLGAISKIAQEHYPERAGKICVLNAPGWFSMLWNVIKVTLHERVQQKVFILSKDSQGDTLKSFINPSDVPVEYGGDMKFGGSSPTANKDFEGPLGKENETARWCSEFEYACFDYVRRLNTGRPLPRPPAAMFKREDYLLDMDTYLKAYTGGWLDHESQLHLPRQQWENNKWPGCLFAGTGAGSGGGGGPGL